MHAAIVGAVLAVTPINLGPTIKPAPIQSKAPAAGVKVAVICFKSGEQVSGMNKICFYNCLGSTVAINVSSVALCPLSIDH